MDPFSLGTGVAGFVSLGLTLCDGILTYCAKYQARDDDTTSLSQHADQLRTFLRLFEHRAISRGPVEADLKAAVQDSLDACSNCLLQVENITSKHSLPIRRANGLRIRSKAIVDRFKYPFQRDELLAFREQLNDLRSTLFGYQLLVDQYVVLRISPANCLSYPDVANVRNFAVT